MCRIMDDAWKVLGEKLLPLFVQGSSTHQTCSIQEQIQDVVKGEVIIISTKRYFIKIISIHLDIITLLLDKHKQYVWIVQLYNYVLVNGLRQRSQHGWCSKNSLTTSLKFSLIAWLQKILTMYHCVFFARHAAAAKCKTYTKQQYDLLFLYNNHLMKQKWAIHTLFKWFCNHYNNSATFQSRMG